jgi:hypothetical protein
VSRFTELSPHRHGLAGDLARPLDIACHREACAEEIEQHPDPVLFLRHICPQTPGESDPLLRHARTLRGLSHREQYEGQIE